MIVPRMGLSHVVRSGVVRTIAASRPYLANTLSMITYESSKLWQSTWFLALALGAGVGVGAWWLQTRAAGTASSASASDSPAPAPVAIKTAVKADVALLVPPKVLEDGRPSDFTPEDWAALKDAMSKTPNPRTELERVVRYLRFQKGFEQWQKLQDGPDVATRHQLAARLLEQVPERMSQGELMMGEAQMLQAALLADLEPNEDVRKQKLERAQAALGAAAPKLDVRQQARDAGLLSEYKRRETAILADYQSRPEPQRNPSKLSDDLETARRAVYASKN